MSNIGNINNNDNVDNVGNVGNENSHDSFHKNIHIFTEVIESKINQYSTDPTDFDLGWESEVLVNHFADDNIYDNIIDDDNDNNDCNDCNDNDDDCDDDGCNDDNIISINIDDSNKNNENNQSNAKLFICNECNYVAKDSTELNDHKLIVHIGAFSEDYICDECGQHFISDTLLNQHYDTEHNSSSDDDNDNSNSAGDSDKKSNIIKKKYISMNLSCDVCKRVFYDIGELQYHKQNAHQLKSKLNNNNISKKIIKHFTKKVDKTLNSASSSALDSTLNNTLDQKKLTYQDFKKLTNEIFENIESNAEIYTQPDIEFSDDRSDELRDILIDIKSIIIKNYNGDPDSEYDSDDISEDSERGLDYSESKIDNVNNNVSNANNANNNTSRYAVSNGNYVCPVCNQKFSTPFYLGEHFTEDHQSYHTQSDLDQMIPKTSFCGFEIMEMIDMIYVPRRNKEINDIIKKNNGVCSICCEQYKTDQSNQSNQNILSDTTNCNIPKNGLELDNLIKSQDETNNFAIVMTCCGNDLCHNCIKKNCFEQNNITCVFCKLDHSMKHPDNLLYISQVELCSFFNNKSWNEWWSKDDKIDMLI